MPEAENTTGQSPSEDSRAESEQAEVASFTPMTEEQLLAIHIGELVPKYARIKWQYTQNYADAKTTVVEEILTRARRHAENTPHG